MVLPRRQRRRGYRRQRQAMAEAAHCARDSPDTGRWGRGDDMRPAAGCSRGPKSIVGRRLRKQGGEGSFCLNFDRMSPILAQTLNFVFSLSPTVFSLATHISVRVPGTLWRAAAWNIRTSNRCEIVRSFVCFDRLPSKEGVLELPGWRMSMPISFGLTVFRKLLERHRGVFEIFDSSLPVLTDLPVAS